jgi:hypothetical protein
VTAVPDRGDRAGPQPVPARVDGLLPLRKLRPPLQPDPDPRAQPARAVSGQTPRTQASLRMATRYIRLAQPYGLDQPRWNRRRAQAPQGLAREMSRMPGGEERRRAVCGRTTCTVRCGGERKPDQSGQHAPRGPGASRRPYNASRRVGRKRSPAQHDRRYRNATKPVTISTRSTPHGAAGFGQEHALGVARAGDRFQHPTGTDACMRIGDLPIRVPRGLSVAVGRREQPRGRPAVPWLRLSDSGRVSRRPEYLRRG